MANSLPSRDRLNQSRLVDCLDSHMHYLQCGQGSPILFLHGMPCSSFMWRNILPELATHSRCVAPDLIGVGKSGQPDIAYSVQDHIRYLEAFMDVLGLNDITLVAHGWGSVIGLDIASRQPERFRAIALCEAHLRPIRRQRDLSLPMQELLKDLGDEEKARRLIVDENFLVESWLPLCTINKLSSEAQQGYREAFSEPKQRQVLLRYLQDLPVSTHGVETNQLIAHYSKWLSATDIPKLLLYALPGFVTPMDTVSWATQNFPNLEAEEVADFALHFIPEAATEAVVESLKCWLP